MRTTRISFGLLALAAMTAGARAGDVWVGNFVGEVDRNQPLGSQVVFQTLCTQINAMIAQGENVFLADSIGNIWKVNSKTNETQFFRQTFMTSTLAVHNGDLLAGCTDGTVRRIRTSDGAVLATLTVGGQVNAMTVEGDTVYIGGHDTLIRKGNATTGGFAVLGACGGQVHSVAINGPELLAAAIDGRIYRIDKVTGQYTLTYPLPAGVGMPLIAMDGAYVVLGGADGLLRWLNPQTGSVQFSTAICTKGQALAIVAECKADTDRSGQLNANDFASYLNVYGAASPHADMDGNGVLNANDFQQFLNAYAAGCP